MASFLLTPNNYKIPQVPGKQALYEKYFFKLVVAVPGASLVRELNTRTERILKKYSDFTSYLYSRKQEQLAWYQRVQSWRSASDPWLEYQFSVFKNLNTDLILEMHELMKKQLSGKHRIDGSNHEIAFYFSDQPELERFLEHFPVKYQSQLLRVENTLLAAGDLQVNQRVVKRRKTLPYKIFIRDQKRVRDSHRAFLSYLESLGSVVEIPRKMKRDFSSTDPQPYYYGLYFYTSDVSVISFAELISPGIIGRVQEFVVAPKPQP